MLKVKNIGGFKKVAKKKHKGGEREGAILQGPI